MRNRIIFAILLLFTTLAASSQRLLITDTVRAKKTVTEKLQLKYDSTKSSSSTQFLVIDSATGIVGRRLGSSGSTSSANYNLPYNGNSLYYLGGDSILHAFPTTNYKLPYNGNSLYYLGGDSVLHLLPTTSGGNYRLPYNGNANYYLGGDSALHPLPSSGTGTVTSVAKGYGILQDGTITTTGTISADSLVISTKAYRQKGIDSLAALIATKQPAGTYLTANQPITVTATGDATGTSTSSPTAPSLPLTLATVNSNVGTFTNATVTVDAKGRVTGVSSGSAGSTGTVTSVATNNGTGIIGGTITSTGTLSLDTTVVSTKANVQKVKDSLQANINANTSAIATNTTNISNNTSAITALQNAAQVTSYQTAIAATNQTAFTFTGVPSSKANSIVDIYGSVVPHNFYSISGNTITFTTGMQSGAIINFREIK